MVSIKGKVNDNNLRSPYLFVNILTNRDRSTLLEEDGLKNLQKVFIELLVIFSKLPTYMYVPSCDISRDLI